MQNTHKHETTIINPIIETTTQKESENTSSFENIIPTETNSIKESTVETDITSTHSHPTLTNTNIDIQSTNDQTTTSITSINEIETNEYSTVSGSLFDLSTSNDMQNTEKHETTIINPVVDTTTENKNEKTTSFENIIPTETTLLTTNFFIFEKVFECNFDNYQSNRNPCGSRYNGSSVVTELKPSFKFTTFESISDESYSLTDFSSICRLLILNLKHRLFP